MSMLLEPDRLQLFPIKYPDLWDYYKKAESSFWTAEEIDLSKDKHDFDNLKEGEQHFISHVLAFFATADALVFDNIDSNFGEEIQIREAKTFYGFQKAIEGIHNETYSLMIETIISDPERRKRVYESVKAFPGLKMKNDWALSFMDRRNADFPIRLLGFIIMEYLFFSSSFAAIFYFRKRNLMNGLCFSNELISRDEGLHAQFGVHLFNNYLTEKPEKKIVHRMVMEAVEIEKTFVKESLPVKLIGMNEELMLQYVMFIADHMLTALQYDKLFNVNNPFEFMELISLQDKTNFFEKRVSAYSLANVGEETQVFSLTEDF